MSNTASLRRTDGGARPVTLDRVATAYAMALLTVVLVTFRPFQPSGPEGSSGGDIVNQLGFSSLGALAVLGMLCFARPRVIGMLVSPWWLLMMAFFALSVMNATDVASAARAAFFTLMGVAVVLAVLSIPRDADALSAVLAGAAVAVLALSYAGIVLLPGTAVHSTASAEPQHAGLWRGLFPHKNVAGPVMACISFIGFYLWRRGWTRIGVVVLVAGTVFMANTGSKTTAGLVPLSILIVILPGLIGMRKLTVLLFLTAIVGTAVATLGLVFIEPVGDLILSWFPGLTYTGRTTLWEFSGEMIAKRPWTGYGYESFWGSPLLLSVDKAFDQDWDISTIVHGHNGYLDIAVIMGVPALVVAAFTFLIEPLRDYLRVPMLRENVYLADLFMMMVLFTTLNAFLESFFFRRVDPVWLFFLIGTLGLRLAARLPMSARAR